MKLSACIRVSLCAVGIMAMFLCCRNKRASPAAALAEAGSRIYYINSYHKGYPASDKIMEGLQQAFSEEKIDLKIFFLDTKNNPEPKTEQVLEEIRQFKPEVIIVSDDAAVKYVYGDEISMFRFK